MEEAGKFVIDHNRAKELVQELRSGKYIQGFNSSSRYINGIRYHCIIGVMGRIADAYVGEDHYHSKTKEYYNTTYSTMSMLVTMNDFVRMSFPQIADKIEELLDAGNNTNSRDKECASEDRK